MRKRNEGLQDIFFTETSVSQTLFKDPYPASINRWYISSDVLGADAYTKEVDALRNATEDDAFYIYINTRGGDLFAALQICQAIRECRGQVVGICDAQVASAGTFIALACPSIVVNQDVYWMSHTASWGLFGKSSDIFTQTDFEKKYFRDLIERHYGGFFTAKEIDAILRGGDFYFDQMEVIERLKKRNAYIKRKAKKLTPTTQDTTNG